MKRIYDSKEPTIKALQNIAENLRKHLKTYTQVTVQATSAHTFKPRYDIEYGIYIESDGQPTHTFETWPETLNFYKHLMRYWGKSNES